MKTELQKAIDQIGEHAVRKSITHAGMSLGFCDVHGHYAFTSTASCPLCPNANGTDATQVEHYIDIKNLISPTSGTNPGQKENPSGLSYQDRMELKEMADEHKEYHEHEHNDANHKD